MNPDPVLVKRVGIAAAYKAGGILLEFLGRVRQVKNKGFRDLVTEADLTAENAIKKTIASRFPDHDILAEESGLNKGSGRCRWIIDPLDGTTNYAHQLGLFCVSIAFEMEGEITTGIVLNPVTGELFSAVKGAGAWLNSNPLNVSGTDRVAKSLLATGFPYDLEDVLPALLKRLSACLSASRGVRRLGSAALDLCYVACGRFDGFWEQNLKPWDTAAGMLIVKEAQGRVTDFTGNRFHIDQTEILATNGLIHKELISLLTAEDRV